MTAITALFFILFGLLTNFNQTIRLHKKSYDATFDEQISFASYYGDNMVLQKFPARAILWGYANHSAMEIKILLDCSWNETVTSYYDSSVDRSVWKVKLPPMKPGGPHNIIVRSLKAELYLSNVLFGDVWICSGQSNMVFTTSMAFNGTQEGIASSNYPDIRVFTVGVNGSNVPYNDFVQIVQPWSVAARDQILGKDWTYFSAVCWMFGRRLYEMHKYPIGLISSSVKGTVIQAWSSPDVMKKCETKEKIDVCCSPYNKHSFLWNAMIHPLVTMTINGVIWYQGESNHRESKLYSCLFPAMIKDWRLKFNNGSDSETSLNFPFGFVQVAPAFNKDRNADYPELRWAQTANVGYAPNKLLPNVFMAVAMDLPDEHSPYGSIHPRYKEDIGSRLLLGLKGISMINQINSFQGPFPQRFFVSKSKILIEYNISLDFRNVVNFEISCICFSNGSSNVLQWYPATASLNMTSSVNVIIPEICSNQAHHIYGVRYAWSPVPCLLKNCSVYGKENLLPAPPFIKMFQTRNNSKEFSGTMEIPS